jgi:hypothetical protein
LSTRRESWGQDVGTGKSTVLNELRRRGHYAVDPHYDGWERTQGLRGF